MLRRRHVVSVLVVCALVVCATVSAQQKISALNNAGIVSMVKGSMPESVIVSVIQSSETQFDLSAGALAELKKAGVSQKVVDAMVAAEARKRVAAPSPAGGRGAARATPGVPLQQPYVQLLEEKAKRTIAVERAQIASAKTKNQDLSSLAAEGVVFQALQGLAAEAAAQAAARSGSSAAGSWGGTASGVVGGLFKKRTPTVTYVWGVVGRTSSTVLPTSTLKFEMAYDAVAGVNAQEYAPVLVKLVPAKNDFRLVGAAKGKEDASQSATPDWELYSSFVEEKIPATLKQSAPGRCELAPAAPLPPGEYALVLRPVARNKKFSGTDLSNNQGEGMLFNSVWTFSVSLSSGTR